MTTPQFLLAILALLLTPGPTNTLLALSGAQAGFRRSLRLLPTELCGYVLTVVPLAIIGADVLAGWPLLGRAIKIVAAAWILYLAVRLWFPVARADEAGAPTMRRVFVTTLLNPKALIFGLVLLPPAYDPRFLPHLGLFVLSVTGVAMLWASGGALLLRRRGAWEASARPLWPCRVAALWLAMLSLGLAAGAMGH